MVSASKIATNWLLYKIPFRLLTVRFRWIRGLDVPAGNTGL